ncbi:hypothetical protein I4U23_019230 [Adineta vaga]|nr:hypothetical protein I4U23_019230 [Adineta vaga]
MFPCDRFGVLHIIRVIIEISLLISMYVFGSCRYGHIYGYDAISSNIYFKIILVMASTDIYYLLLSIFSIENPQRKPMFHIIFYSFMSLLALVCCVFSIIAYIYCVQHKYNRLCNNHSCAILWISISLTFLLTIMYSGSTKLLCCIR